MSDDELLSALLDQIGTLAEGVQAVMENQQSLAAKLDAQAAEQEAQAKSLAAIGVAIGMTYLATGTETPLPIDVLEDRAFASFLENYPLDGPPITGKAVMAEHLAQLDQVEPARLAAGFRDLERQTHLTMIERIRNRQIERIARERYGDLEAIEKGRAVTGAPTREADR
ncbi:hypothetical protein [Rhizorhapis suberifaciens]|uniref:Uncharacterized protein n=1 Tax=Rhizorhapis suberifaciens TaxID=13656 RepID=A0A840HWQ3_9SPHN|nr:hypothetical protein [Rhizorhapis suberifaciens]MBB4642782.1 hypothetical protein [Rhizorhapis suberifaciens]